MACSGWQGSASWTPLTANRTYYIEVWHACSEWCGPGHSGGELKVEMRIRGAGNTCGADGTPVVPAVLFTQATAEDDGGGVVQVDPKLTPS